MKIKFEKLTNEVLERALRNCRRKVKTQLEKQKLNGCNCIIGAKKERNVFLLFQRFWFVLI